MSTPPVGLDLDNLSLLGRRQFEVVWSPHSGLGSSSEVQHINGAFRLFHDSHPEAEVVAIFYSLRIGEGYEAKSTLTVEYEDDASEGQ